MKTNSNEITIYFSKNWIRTILDMPSANGETYRLCIIEMPDDEGKEQKTKRTFTQYESNIETDEKNEYIRRTKLIKNGKYRVQRADYDRETKVRKILEQHEMSGQEIADVFRRYSERKRKELENSFIPKDGGNT